jgi:hypothetical protein
LIRVADGSSTFHVWVHDVPHPGSGFAVHEDDAGDVRGCGIRWDAEDFAGFWAEGALLHPQVANLQLHASFACERAVADQLFQAFV